MSELVGNPLGGDPFTRICAPGEVVTGLEVMISQEGVVGISVDCGRLDLQLAASGYAVTVIPVSTLAMAGGHFDGQTPDFRRCGMNAFVTQVQGSTVAFSFTSGVSEILQSLTLFCSTATVDGAGVLTFSSPSVTDALGGAVIEPPHSFDVSCPGGAVNGFTGRAGAGIDQISVSCARLSIAKQ